MKEYSENELRESLKSRSQTAISLISAANIYEKEKDSKIFFDVYTSIINDAKTAKEFLIDEDELQVVIAADLIGSVSSLMFSIEEEMHKPVAKSYMEIPTYFNQEPPEFVYTLLEMIRTAVFEKTTGLSNVLHYAIPLDRIEPNQRPSFLLLLARSTLYLLKEIADDSGKTIDSIIQEFAERFI